MRTVSARKRTTAPKVVTRTEVPVESSPKKASIWSRAKVIVVKTAKRVATFVKSTVARAKTTAARTAVRVLPIARRAWSVALRPFLRGVAAGLAFFGLIVGALVAPLATVLALVVAAGLMFLLARVVRSAEEIADRSRFARIVLVVFEIIGRTVQVLFYAVAALATVALCSVSWPFAIYAVLALVLAYFDVRGAGTIAFLAWCALSGAWALGILWLLWRAAARIPARQVPEYSEIRREPLVHEDVLRREPTDQVEHVAKGTEEVADLVEHDIACAACGSRERSMRVRSNDVAIVTGGTGKGKPGQASTDMLCASCYDAECEDIALTTTGVSLHQRSVLVQLNEIGRSMLPEVAASKADPTNLFWAPTAWWRDRRGHCHERQWDCFAGGKLVASVIYDHQRRVFRASVLGQFKGTKSTEGQAKRLASDTLLDEGNAVARMTEALAEVEGGTATAATTS